MLLDKNERSYYIRDMNKGKKTKRDILDHALTMASTVGLEGLTIGDLAKRVNMSKSGLYAHFESKEDLQIQVLNTAAERFVDVVLAPALKQPRGLPRVKAIFDGWLEWTTGELKGGCLFISAATEFDDRFGPVRNKLVAHLRDVSGAILRAVTIGVEEGHFRPDLDIIQFTFEFWGILLTYHHYSRLMRQADARERAQRALTRILEHAAM